MNQIKAHITGSIIATNDALAHTLYHKSAFGEPKDAKIRYMAAEALYLSQKKKLSVYKKDKELSSKELFTALKKIDKKLDKKFPVYKDLRNKGYIVKTALKFGADFRVYPKGIKPGKDHAQWIVFCENESQKLAWQDFSAKNRVAHSTKKKLLLAILDEESDVSYYEVSWVKP